MFNILKRKDQEPKKEDKEWLKIKDQNDDLFNIALNITEGKATA